MKFSITTLLVATAVAALGSLIAVGDPLLSIGFIIIVVPTVIGTFIAAKMGTARQTDSPKNDPTGS